MPFGEPSESSSVYILLAIFFLICYLLLTVLLAQRHFPLHRTAVAILVGIVAGLVLKLAAPGAYRAITKLDEFIIFSVLFPPMIFAQGYTLHKSVFFKNIRYILVFGLLGTFLSFGVTWGLVYQANQWDLVRDSGNYSNVRALSDWEILLLAACLCSIDTISAEETVCEHKYPRLYSVVFGENLIKDTVTIVLFSSVLALQTPESPKKLEIHWYTFFQLLLNFLVLILGSVAAGVVSAFAATFLCKKMRFMTSDKGVSETGFLFLVGFYTYILTEMLGFSGSISLLLYGILLNHYNIYNMSVQSRHASVSTFTLLSNLCEGGLFLIMGILVWQGQWESPPTDQDTMTHSYIFFFAVFLILCLARAVNIYLLGWLARLLTRGKFSFCFEEMHILFVGGLVRGAIPFVLFTSVSFTKNNNYIKNEGVVLKTTIIFVIIFTSLFINSLIPVIYKRRLKYLKREYRKIFGERKRLGEAEGRQGDEARQGATGANQDKDGLNRVGRVKGCEERVIKRTLILDYEERRESIRLEKRQRVQAILAEALADDSPSEEDDMLTEQDKAGVMLLN